MKELPILFSTPMVQAILEGRKTQTRRVMKPQITACDHSFAIESDWKDQPTRWSKVALEKGLAYCELCGNGTGYENSFEGIKCPYGQPGDILWVRETWGVGSRPNPFLGNVDGIEFKSDGKYIDEIESLPLHFYDDFDYGNYDKSGWRPSIHMPKSISRIWLQVTDIKVERLQDISDDDAIAEGAEPRHHRCGGFGYYEAGGDIQDCICQNWDRAPEVMGFFDLWEEINGKESLDSNPWVWSISFKVLSTTGKPDLQNLKAIG